MDNFDLLNAEFDELVGLVVPKLQDVRHLFGYGNCADVVVQYFRQVQQRERPVIKFSTAEALKDKIALTLPEARESIEQFSSFLDGVLEWSACTSHPLFVDKLYAGADPASMIAELVTAALNTNVHVCNFADVRILSANQS